MRSANPPVWHRGWRRSTTTASLRATSGSLRMSTSHDGTCCCSTTPGPAAPALPPPRSRCGAPARNGSASWSSDGGWPPDTRATPGSSKAACETRTTRACARSPAAGARDGPPRCGSKIESVGVEAALGAVCGGGAHAFVRGPPGAHGGGVFPPCGGPRRATPVIARQHVGDRVGKQMPLRPSGFGVHGARAVVVTQDRPEHIGGGVFVAAPQPVDLRTCDRSGVFVIGLAVQAPIYVGMVVLAAPGHRHIQHGAGGALTDDRMAAVGRDTLGRVHRGGVAQGDVLAQILALEHHPRLVGGAFGR